MFASVLFSALLLASTFPCNCHAQSEFFADDGSPARGHSTGGTHSCGSRDEPHDDNSPGNFPRDTGPGEKDHGTDPRCCCSAKSLSAFFDMEVLNLAQSNTVPEPLRLAPDELLWNLNKRFIKQFDVVRKRTLFEGVPSTIISSSTLSVRLQRWLL